MVCRYFPPLRKASPNYLLTSNHAIVPEMRLTMVRTLLLVDPSAFARLLGAFVHSFFVRWRTDDRVHQSAGARERFRAGPPSVAFFRPTPSALRCWLLPDSTPHGLTCCCCGRVTVAIRHAERAGSGCGGHYRPRRYRAIRSGRPKWCLMVRCADVCRGFVARAVTKQIITFLSPDRAPGFWVRTQPDFRLSGAESAGLPARLVRAERHAGSFEPDVGADRRGHLCVRPVAAHHGDQGRILHRCCSQNLPLLLGPLPLRRCACVASQSSPSRA